MSPSKADLAKIHIAKKELGLTEEVYRDILQQQFRRESAAQLTPGQAGKLIAHFRRMGWKPKIQRQLPGSTVPADGQSRKILALWITLYKKGIVRDGSDKALMNFVRRVTATSVSRGKDHLKWCTNDEKNNIIEALKGWGTREGVS